jgi:uncharacterized membrane protein
MEKEKNLRLFSSIISLISAILNFIFFLINSSPLLLATAILCFWNYRKNKTIYTNIMNDELDRSLKEKYNFYNPD